MDDLYRTDGMIFGRNLRRGVSERTIVSRLAYHLQRRLSTDSDYLVDCDFNSHYIMRVDREGRVSASEGRGKPILNPVGTTTKRFIDIIVHRRDQDPDNDLICFEVKKWNNRNDEGDRKDWNNLQVLTSKYGYLYGFWLTLGREKTASTWTIFHRGKDIVGDERIFAGV